MEYPPWGLVSCWGRKLLGVKVPPPDTGVWEMGATGSEEKLGSPGYPGASLSLVRLVGAGLLPQTSTWGLLQLGGGVGWERRCLCEQLVVPGGLAEKERGGSLGFEGSQCRGTGAQQGSQQQAGDSWCLGRSGCCCYSPSPSYVA